MSVIDHLRRYVRNGYMAAGLVFTLLPAAGETGDNASAAKAAQPEGQAVAKYTPSANVSKLQAWKDAELIASLAPDRLEVVGTGDSMAPVYGEATILVISRVKYSELKPGMSVAYKSRRGMPIVHQLVSRRRSGWKVRGLNNSTADTERVTPNNLIGVVYASLAYDPSLN